MKKLNYETYPLNFFIDCCSIDKLKSFWKHLGCFVRLLQGILKFRVLKYFYIFLDYFGAFGNYLVSLKL